MAQKPLNDKQRVYLKRVIQILETKYSPEDRLYLNTLYGANNYPVSLVSSILEQYVREGWYGDMNERWLNDLPRALNLTKL